MKEIQLTQGQVAVVDDEDCAKVNGYIWHACKNGKTWYAQANDRNRKTIMMHRVILDVPDGVLVDHINQNGLDNRKENLRSCSRAENICNAGVYKNSTTGFKGVHKSLGKYMAKIRKNGNQIYLGTFDTAEEAAYAYNEAAKIYHGDFAFLNP